MLLTGVSALPQRINLPEAVNLALKNSLDIQVSKANVDIAHEYNNFGYAGGLPVVTASGSDNESLTAVNQKINTGEVIKRDGATANILSANVTAGILLYNGSRVWATKKRLEELELQNQDLLNSQVQNVIASVMTAYYDVVRQQYYVKTIDRSIDVANKKLDIVKAQQSVGLANNADLFQVQLDLNTLVQARQSQLLVIDQSKTELLRLLTAKPDSVIEVQDTIVVDSTLLLGTILDNLHTNGDIRAANEQVLINIQIMKETAAQRYPTVRASTGYNYSRNQASAGQLLLNQSQGPFVGLSLGIPIYNGSIYLRQEKAAELNTHIAEYQKEILLRDYSANIVKTYQAYSSSLNQLETQWKNFRLAQQLVDIVLQRFQFRQATIVDLSQAQQSFLVASYSLVNFAFSAKAAEIELKRVANTLSPN